jgi:hypothetical protein
VKPVGIAVAFVGYTLAYFGWYSLKGPGVGILDLIIPGRTTIIQGTGTFGVSSTGQPTGMLTCAQWKKLTPAIRATVPPFARPIGCT